MLTTDLIGKINQEDICKITIEDIGSRDIDYDSICHIEYFSGTKKDYYYYVGKGWEEKK